VSIRNTWDDLQWQMIEVQQHASSQQEFEMLKPGLMKLRTFTDYYVRQLIPKLDTSIFWGFVRLVIKV